MARTPRYELHIRPMMRLIDRDAMLFKFDLFSYNDVVGNAPRILSRVSGGTMPPASRGGPWPQEWVDLFRRWRDAGFPRLELTTATYTATRTSAGVTLKAEGDFPSEDDNGWFERLNESESPREYAFYREPGDPGEPQPFEVKQPLPSTPGVNVVVVHDADGRHEVPIT
jgi:hypothetical protein